MTACLVGAYFLQQGGKGSAKLTRKSMDNLHYLALRKLAIRTNVSAQFAAWLLGRPFATGCFWPFSARCQRQLLAQSV